MAGRIVDQAARHGEPSRLLEKTRVDPVSGLYSRRSEEQRRLAFLNAKQKLEELLAVLVAEGETIEADAVRAALVALTELFPMYKGQ